MTYREVKTWHEQFLRGEPARIDRLEALRSIVRTSQFGQRGLTRIYGNLEGNRSIDPSIRGVEQTTLMQRSANSAQAKGYRRELLYAIEFHNDPRFSLEEMKRFIEEHPNSPMAEQAERARTAFAHKRLRAGSVGGFRPDVMIYISQALQTFGPLGPQKCRAIALEIAMLGRNGLDINDPTEKYTLKSLPGKFSGLHLLAIMYTAFHQIDPTMDTGADFSAEYQAALEMQKT